MTISIRDTLFALGGIAIGAVAIGRAWAQAPAPGPSPGQQIAATAAARAPVAAPGMPGVRYQYMCQTKWPERMYDGEVQRRLNDLGGQGWHLLPPLVARAPGIGYADVYCFERAY